MGTETLHWKVVDTRVARWFVSKNPNLGKFWSVLQWKMLLYFMDTWSFLRSFDFMDIWCSSRYFGIFCSRVGILYQEKSGNPGRYARAKKMNGISALDTNNGK
jgi:hypothetical protein